MKLVVAKRAERQIETIDAWWRENRPDATVTFLEEFTQTTRFLLDVPSAGTRWPTERRPRLKRIYLERSENHIYFEVRGQAVHVIAVWGAVKARVPKL